MAEPDELYLDLRRQALAVTADLLAEAPAEGSPLALLMETGYPEAVATLLGVADGTTSLYFSNGGGTIGAGEHAEVAAATRRWLADAGGFVSAWDPVEGEPGLPRVGETQFVAVTPDGLRALVAPEDDLGEERHPASPVFHAAHEVITRLRLVEEGSREG